ncbi:MAG: signal peptidase I [Acidobacteria bacterium]|nr:signal peptidase I [Acidobacteriota bacterium]
MRVAREVSEWAVNILILLFATTTIAQPFVVPTGSMENTVLIGDHLIVDKLAYSPPGAISRYILPYTPVKRGDIIVFRYPLNLKENYVKRVIGMPGDRLKIRDRQVYLNGAKIDEPYKRHIREWTDLYRDNFPTDPPPHLPERARAMLRDHVAGGELVVPPDHYFAMGDNRDNSADSRYWGLVPRENIVGKPLLIFWSYDAPTGELVDVINFDHLKDLALNFFVKTRWERTFRLVR